MRLTKMESGPTADDAHSWGDVFARIAMSDGNERLTIGVSTGQVALLRLLAAELEPPFTLLYVLLVPREGQENGRYERGELDANELAEFLGRYAAMLEQDGRHALWIIAATGQIVFTPHDIVYAYGPIERFRDILVRRDSAENRVSIPNPHAHRYHGAFDASVADLLSRYAWIRYELHDIDDET